MIHVKWKLQAYWSCTNSPSFDEENTALSLIWIIIPTVLCPYFQDRYTNIHTHGWMQQWTNETQQKHDDYVVFSPPSHWITSFMPPLQFPNVSYPSFSPVKVVDALLFSCVMDNVYHGHDKLFPHKRFCHGLLLAVMWDSACRLKQP